MPTNVIDKKGRERWKEGGETSIFDRAKQIVEEKLANHRPVPLEQGREAKLDQVLIKIMQEMNIDRLPVNPVSCMKGE